MRSTARLWQSRIAIVGLGVLLGFAARFVLGPPVPENNRPTREFEQPLPDYVPIDLPISQLQAPDKQDVGSNRTSDLSFSNIESGFVEPFDFSLMTVDSTVDKSPDLEVKQTVREYKVDFSALFEPHGEEVCASGCALSRHPTESLSKNEFLRLLGEFFNGPLSSENEALESLLYFGPQTMAYLKIDDALNRQNADSQVEFLKRQLQFTHAKISIRVVDSEQKSRTWIEPTVVPLDRRHVFEMKTDQLQPLVTSGTVKRVGLNHLWTRL